MSHELIACSNEPLLPSHVALSPLAYHIAEVASGPVYCEQRGTAPVKNSSADTLVSRNAFPKRMWTQMLLANIRADPHASTYYFLFCWNPRFPKYRQQIRAARWKNINNFASYWSLPAYGRRSRDLWGKHVWRLRHRERLHWCMPLAWRPLWATDSPRTHGNLLRLQVRYAWPDKKRIGNK